MGGVYGYIIYYIIAFIINNYYITNLTKPVSFIAIQLLILARQEGVCI